MSTLRVIKEARRNLDLKGERNIENIRFHCLGPVSKNLKDYHPNGFLRCGDIEIFPPSEYGCVTLFNVSYSFHDALLFHTTELFSNCRKSFMLIDFMTMKQEKATQIRLTSSVRPLAKIRKDISYFFNYIWTFLRTMSNEHAGTNFINELEEQLWLLRILFHKFSCVRLPDDPLAFYASSLGDQCSDPAFHLVHCHLDTRWLYLNVIQCIESYKSKVNPTTITDFTLCVDEEIMIVLSELLWFAENRYKKTDKTELGKTQIYSCNCVKELWLLLMHFPYKTEDFLTYFNQTLRIFMENTKRKPRPKFERPILKILPAEFLQCSNRNEFIIWLIAGVAELQEYDSEGNFVGAIDGKVSNSFEILDDVVKNVLTDGDGPSEALIRSLLPMIHKIHSVWGFSKSGSLMSLCEYYYKRINNGFHIPSSELDGMIVISKTGQALLEDVRDRLAGESRDQNGNSFFMFLRLLGDHLQASRRVGASVTRLCTRVFIKFPPGKVEKLKELSDQGIFNLASLFLTLAIGSASPSMIGKLVNLVAAIPRSDLNEEKHEMIWKVYSACILAAEEMHSDLTEIAGVIYKHIDWCHDRQLLSPIGHLVDALYILFTKVPISLKGLHLFITPWISTYFKLGSKDEGARVLSIFKPLLRNLRKPVALGNREARFLLAKCEEVVRPLLNKEPNCLTAELAALFTILSSGHKLEIFQNWNDLKDCSLSRIYLCTLFEMEPRVVSTFLPQAPASAVQVWLRCMFYMGNTEENRKLSHIVGNLPQVSNILIDWNGEDPLIEFINYYKTEYCLLQALFDKSALRENFLSNFKNFDKWLEGYTKHLDQLPITQIECLFKYSSELFVCCPQLIYTRSNPKSLLKTFVDCLLLTPHIYKPEYLPPNVVVKSICKYLPKFIQALISLDPDSDAYIGRLYRDLIVQYIPRLTDTPLNYHPVLSLIINISFTPRLIKVLQTFLEVRGMTVHNLAMHVLKLLYQAAVIGEGEVLSCLFDHTIDLALDIMYVLDELHPMKLIAFEYCSVLLKSARNRFKMLTTLSNSCKKYLSLNSTLWFSSISKLIPLCRKEIEPLVYTIEEEVISIEKMKGVERDIVLRTDLDSIKLALGGQ